MPKSYSIIATRQTVIELDTTVLDRLIAQTPARAEQIVSETAVDVQIKTQASMKEQGTGRIYIRGNRAHQASAPGEPPAVDIGTLRASIEARQEAPLLWRVDVGQEYGVYLEFGTSRMAARPFLFPAVFRVERTLERRWLELMR